MAYKAIPNPLLKYQFRDVEMHKKYFIDGPSGDADVGMIVLPYSSFGAEPNTVTGL